MMFVLMEGVILRRSYTGWGPFRRERWDEEKFVWKFAKPGERQGTDGVELVRNDVAGKIVIEGKIGSVSIYLATFDTTQPCQPVDFSMLSVAGIQVSGKATLVGSMSRAQESDVQVA